MANNVTEIVNGKDFDKFTKRGLVLVDFFADWCMPCIMMAPVMEELAKKFKSKVKFGKIDVDDNQEIAQKFHVVSIPNFILFHNGEIKERFVGTMPSEDFEEKLKKQI